MKGKKGKGKSKLVSELIPVVEIQNSHSFEQMDAPPLSSQSSTLPKVEAKFRDKEAEAEFLQKTVYGLLTDTFFIKEQKILAEKIISDLVKLNNLHSPGAQIEAYQYDNIERKIEAGLDEMYRNVPSDHLALRKYLDGFERALKGIILAMRLNMLDMLEALNKDPSVLSKMEADELHPPAFFQPSRSVPGGQNSVTITTNFEPKVAIRTIPKLTQAEQEEEDFYEVERILAQERLEKQKARKEALESEKIERQIKKAERSEGRSKRIEKRQAIIEGKNESTEAPKKKRKVAEINAFDDVVKTKSSTVQFSSSGPDAEVMPAVAVTSGAARRPPRNTKSSTKS